MLKKIFTPKQIDLLLHEKKSKVKWSIEDIASAIALRSLSPKAYRYLRKNNFPLPGLSTLKEWASRLDLSVGVLKDILTLMKNKASDMEFPAKICVLCFDEIHISRKVEIEKKKEQVYGPHKKVQVGIVRGLFRKWKQVIYYNFDTPLTETILINVISQLYEVGFIVVAFICDLDSTNNKLINNLNVGIKANQNCYFSHPGNPLYKVFVINDPPHLLKLIRNHFLDHGFSVDGKVINQDCVKEAVALNEKRDLKVVFKIRKEHLEVRGIKRQKVLPAAQLFSKTTARGILWCGQQQFLQSTNYAETAEFMEIIDAWFDIFNSKICHDYKPGKEPYGLNLTSQNEILDKVTQIISNMKVGNNKTLLPFQKGIIVSNAALQQLLPYLKEQFSSEIFPISYILTNRLTQDVLENLFSYLRAMGGAHELPSSLNFYHRLKWFILGKHADSVISDKTNTEKDDDDFLINFQDSSDKMMAYNKCFDVNDKINDDLYLFSTRVELTNNSEGVSEVDNDVDSSSEYLSE